MSGVATERAPGVPAEEARDLGEEEEMSEENLLALPEEFRERRLRERGVPRPDSPEEWARWRLLFWKDENGQIPSNALLDAAAQMAALPPA